MSNLFFSHTCLDNILLAPKVSKGSMGAFYFCMRVIGDCDYGVCGDCNAFDLVTVRKLGWLL